MTEAKQKLMFVGLGSSFKWEIPGSKIKIINQWTSLKSHVLLTNKVYLSSWNHWKCMTFISRENRSKVGMQEGFGIRKRHMWECIRSYIQNIYQLEFQRHRLLKKEEFQHRDLETSLIPGFILLVAGLWGKQGGWGRPEILGLGAYSGYWRN